MKIKNRVKSHEDFQKVIQKNQSVSNKIFVVYYKKNELGYARIGISTSKKLGNAVVRNKIRRQVRVIVKEVIDFNQSIDYCIIVRKSYLSNDYSNNVTELKYLNDKINRRIQNEKN